MSAFLVVAGFVFWGMQAAVGGWLYFAFPQLGLRGPVAVLPLLGTAFFLLTAWYTRSHFGVAETALYYAAYAWAGLVFIAFSLCAAFTVLQWVLFFFHVNARAILGPLSVGLMAVFFILAVWGGQQNPVIKQVDVEVPGAPRFTAAILSDTHLGVGISPKRYGRVLEALKPYQPQALFVLGDYYEHGADSTPYEQLTKAFITPQGSYGVLGNHEYYNGYENALGIYHQSGITPLQNQTVTLQDGVQVTGVNDIRSTHITAEQLGQLLDQAPSSPLHILLSHQPALVEEAAKHNVHIMLSGHTHNGQVFPFNYLVRLQHRFPYGLFKEGNMHLYVTSGWFYWGIPLRLFAPSEAIILRVNP